MRFDSNLIDDWGSGKTRGIQCCKLKAMYSVRILVVDSTTTLFKCASKLGLPIATRQQLLISPDCADIISVPRRPVSEICEYQNRQSRPHCRSHQFSSHTTSTLRIMGKPSTVYLSAAWIELSRYTNSHFNMTSPILVSPTDQPSLELKPAAEEGAMAMKRQHRSVVPSDHATEGAPHDCTQVLHDPVSPDATSPSSV